MADLSDIIERLEKAEEPSRDLDVEIMNALAPRSPDEKRLFDGKVYPATWGAVGQVCDHIRYFVEAPFLTSSIDAAVSLAERVLPGHWRRIMDLTPLTDVVGFPSAYVLATLRALQQKGSSNG